MKKVPVYFFIGLATVLFGYAMPTQSTTVAVAAESAENTADVFVNISALTAEFINKAIEIKWEADSELDNKQFEIQRSADGKEFKTIGLVFTLDDENFPRKYFFKDNLKGVGAKKLFYRIKQTNTDDDFNYSDVVTTALHKKRM